VPTTPPPRPSPARGEGGRRKRTAAFSGPLPPCGGGLGWGVASHYQRPLNGSGDHPRMSCWKSQPCRQSMKSNLQTLEWTMDESTIRCRSAPSQVHRLSRSSTIGHRSSAGQGYPRVLQVHPSGPLVEIFSLRWRPMRYNDRMNPSLSALAMGTKSNAKTTPFAGDLPGRRGDVRVRPAGELSRRRATASCVGGVDFGKHGHKAGS
jgi:hypothetical protein